MNPETPGGHAGPELLGRLQSVLAGSYAIEREIGRGGMARVFLARDLRHGRPVAIKVFLPEVAAAFGTGRFVREIRTAANLSHPNILALYDSGEAGGLYYYVMPYVEGESLAHRLTRDGPLPIDAALVITRQVAAALQHAHSRGIVHRDIKPGNILLSGGNAFVADFGIAQALEETGAEKLTSTGFALGTPAYMSPEQSGGYGQLDGRADIYSLGCVLYEMLTGEPPFSGRSAQAVLARHSVERVPSVRAVRPTVPWAIEQVIHRAMAKLPVDRFATAEEFAAALAPDRLAEPAPVEAIAPPPSRRTRVVWMAAGGTLAVVLLAIAGAKQDWFSTRREPPLNADLLAVLPFQVGGGADTGLARIAAGMADRVAQEFTGEGAPRAVLPATVRASLRASGHTEVGDLDETAALATGRALGAGLIVLGELSRTGDRWQLSAVLKRTPSGEVVTQAHRMAAGRDSVLSVLDGLIADLLAGAAREPSDRRAALAELPLPVLRSYLAARRLYSRGQFESAVERYRDVLRAEPTCALAALGLATAAEFYNDSLRNVGIAQALTLRDRLLPADQRILDALRGPRFPKEAAIPERITGWQTAVTEAPDRVEAHYHQGEILFHEGTWTDDQDVLRIAADAFQKTVQLEPRFLPALAHLIDLAASAGDTARVRALGTRYLAVDSTTALADYYRWRLAVALGDLPARRRLVARFDSLNPAVLERIAIVTQVDGVALEDGLQAAHTRWARTGLRDLVIFGMFKLREVALNRGRPLEADSLTRAWIASRPLRARNRLSLVVDALFWGADTAIVSGFVSEQAARVDTALPARADDIFFDVCAVNLWRVSRGDHARVPAAIAALRRVPNALADPQTVYIRLCADILDAELAAAERRPDARQRLERLDSLLVTAPPAITWILAAGNLTAARLWEQLGNLPRAFAATRRRLYLPDLTQQRVLVAHSTFLREEGRLAALVGDRQSAIRANRIFLTLHTDPEPARAAEVARVRAALDSLVAGFRNQESGVRGKPTDP